MKRRYIVITYYDGTLSRIIFDDWYYLVKETDLILHIFHDLISDIHVEIIDERNSKNEEDI